MGNLDQKDFMENSQGHLVPVKLVAEIDIARDDLVREMAAKAKGLRDAMAEFKRRAMGDVSAFVDLSAEKYGVEIGGGKGNITLTSFDGRMKIQLAISDSLVFDERLQAAKKLVDECLTEWSADSRDEIKIIVQDAFQVDKEGRINIGRILALRRLNIADEKWQRAMTAISDSLQVVGSKSYIRIYERENSESKWRQIALDIAAL